jgi:hypothetical protein
MLEGCHGAQQMRIIPGGPWAPPEVKRHTFYGQHWTRGDCRDSNGGVLARWNIGDTWRLRAGIFRSESLQKRNFGDIMRNVQPLFAELDTGGFAVAHNGNLTNGLTLRRDLIKEGSIYQSTSDTEVVLHLVARSRKTKILDRYIEALRALEGAYSLVALSNKKLIGARDPLGIRPLVLGELDGHYILASETCALDIIGARFVRDVENGEVVVISEDGIESHKPFPAQQARPCIFEYIYFARPDSYVHGRHVYDVRKRMGAELAREAHIDADVIVPVPDSGVPAAIGYAQASNIPFELGNRGGSIGIEHRIAERAHARRGTAKRQTLIRRDRQHGQRLITDPLRPRDGAHWLQVRQRRRARHPGGLDRPRPAARHPPGGWSLQWLARPWRGSLDCRGRLRLGAGANPLPPGSNFGDSR